MSEIGVNMKAFSGNTYADGLDSL